MGLDGVELVMECEDEFGISISDADAAATCTPGQLTELVIRLMHRDGTPPHASVCPTAMLFYQLRHRLIEEGVPRSRIRPREQIHEVFQTHRRLWLSRYTLLTHLGVHLKRMKSNVYEDFLTKSLRELIQQSVAASTPFDCSAEELVVWLRVRTIVAEQLGRSVKDVTPDADFVKDLGMC